MSRNQEARLVSAVFKSDVAEVEAALDAGANISAYNNIALRTAIICGDAKMVKLLLERGADIHVGVDRCMDYAKSHQYTDVVKLLEDWLAGKRDAVLSAPTESDIKFAEFRVHKNKLEKFKRPEHFGRTSEMER